MGPFPKWRPRPRTNEHHRRAEDHLPAASIAAPLHRCCKLKWMGCMYSTPTRHPARPCPSPAGLPSVPARSSSRRARNVDVCFFRPQSRETFVTVQNRTLSFPTRYSGSTHGPSLQSLGRRQRPVAPTLPDAARCCFRRDTSYTCRQSPRPSLANDRKLDALSTAALPLAARIIMLSIYRSTASSSSVLGRCTSPASAEARVDHRPAGCHLSKRPTITVPLLPSQRTS